MEENTNKNNILHDDSKKFDDNIDDHWMDIVTKSIDDLKPSMSEFISTKQSFDATQLSTKIFFKELMLYIGDQHSYLLMTTPIEPEKWKNAASKIYSMLRFVKPAFEDINFLRHICCMKAMGWMNLLLSDNSLPFKIKDLICDYSIQHLKATEYDDHMSEGIFILSHLLESILKDKCTSKEIEICLHKLLDLREFIRLPDWFENDFMNDLRKQVIDSIFSKNVYSTKDGIIWASYVLAANKKFYRRTMLEGFWTQIKTIDETGFVAFGEIFFNAWHLANSETKIEIENIFIQRLMKESLIFNVKVDENEKRLKKLFFTTLNKLHSYRHKLSFSYTLTNLYKPLLWRYLCSSVEIERRYAAEVFFDVFPLEMSRAMDHEVFIDRQVKVVKNLLSDESHEIRILAIKSICYHLIHSSACFTVLHVKTILSIIADDLATDESYLVRITVFEEFCKMLDYPESRKLMFHILPAMGSLINDKHESVRKAFIDILIKIHKRRKEFKMNYCKIVSTFDLLQRIDREGPVIGKQISILIYPKLFSTGQQINLTIKKLKIMCGINPKAPMCVVKYAKDEMNFSKAYEIVSSIMEYIKESLNEYRKIGGARTNNSIQKPIVSGGTDTISCSEFLRNHKLVISTLETITCIWELFHDEFVDGMFDSCKNLYTTSKVVIPLLYKFYKEPPVIKAIKELLNVTKTKNNSS